MRWETIVYILYNYDFNHAFDDPFSDSAILCEFPLSQRADISLLFQFVSALYEFEADI